MTGNKKINIQFIDGKDQRYPTCGDYWETEDSYEFRITKQDDPKKNLLIFLHEFIEYCLCTERGITEESIMEFDLKWNKLNDEGHTISDEPGNAKAINGMKNPYYKEHRIAENYERQLASHLNIDWQDYDSNLIL